MWRSTTHLALVTFFIFAASLIGFVHVHKNDLMNMCCDNWRCHNKLYPIWERKVNCNCRQTSLSCSVWSRCKDIWQLFVSEWNEFSLDLHIYWILHARQDAINVRIVILLNEIAIVIFYTKKWKRYFVIIAKSIGIEEHGKQRAIPNDIDSMKSPSLTQLIHWNGKLFDF